MTHRTGKRLVLASPLMLIVAFLATHFFTVHSGRESSLWVFGAIWLAVCLGGAAWSWSKD